MAVVSEWKETGFYVFPHSWLPTAAEHGARAGRRAVCGGDAGADGCNPERTEAATQSRHHSASGEARD